MERQTEAAPAAAHPAEDLSVDLPHPKGRKPRGQHDTTSPLPTHTLTEKQRRFIDEFMVDEDGTNAAIRAGYSPKSAHAAAHHLLRHTKIKAVLHKRREEIAKASIREMVAGGPQWVLQELENIANYTSDQLVAQGGKLRDRLTALQTLARIYGLEEQHAHISIQGSVVQVVTVGPDGAERAGPGGLIISANPVEHADGYIEDDTPPRGPVGEPAPTD